MKIVADKRIPGLEEGVGKLLACLKVKHDFVAKEGTEITAADVRDADVIFVRTRTRCNSSLLGGSSVRLVATATIGTDHIDLPWCEANGIGVVNAPGCNAPAVMQYVASALHGAGFDPSKSVLGVIGKGNIGSLVADLYRRAGTKVLVCDPPRKDSGFADEDYLDFEEVLAGSDAVTFHVPYGNAGKYPTHHLLTPEILARHSRPRIIVNSSRGLVIHPDILTGAEVGPTGRKLVIDTWPFEDEPESWEETRRSEIIASAFISTPHIAGYSSEGKERATEAMLRALEVFISGSDVLKPSAPTFGPFCLSDVISSFDVMSVSQALKSSPADFERLRASHLRPEPWSDSSLKF